MSQVKLSGNASGSGSVTIASPNTNSAYTMTLPAATGNFISSADTGTVTQTMLGTNVAGNGPAFSAYLSANQSITGSTWTKAQLNTENFDTNSYFDNATNYRFTPLISGYYQINASINGEASTTRTRILVAIYKNAVEYKRSDMNYTNANSSFVADVVYFNGSTDYVELYGFIAGTGTVFVGGNYATFFSGAMVRSA